VTLTLTSDHLESYIVVNVSSTLTNTTIWFVAALCFIVDVRTHYTDGQTESGIFNFSHNFANVDQFSKFIH